MRFRLWIGDLEGGVAVDQYAVDQYAVEWSNAMRERGYDNVRASNSFG